MRWLTLVLLVAALLLPSAVTAQPPGGYSLLPDADPDEGLPELRSPRRAAAAVGTAPASSRYTRRAASAVGTASASSHYTRRAASAVGTASAAPPNDDEGVPWYYDMPVTAAAAGPVSPTAERHFWPAEGTGSAAVVSSGNENLTQHEVEIEVEPGLSVRLDITALVVDRRPNGDRGGGSGGGQYSV